MLFAAAGRGGGAAGAAAGNPQVVDLTDPAVEPIGAPPIRKSQHTIMNFIVLARTAEPIGAALFLDGRGVMEPH